MKIIGTTIFLAFCISLFGLGCVADNYSNSPYLPLPQGAEPQVHRILILQKSNQVIELTSALTPGLAFTGRVVDPGEGQELEIELNELRFFTNWSSGWTEGTFQASGRLVLLTAPDTGLFHMELKEPVEVWDIISGEIRFLNTYYRGKDGSEKVRGRVDRIRELCRWLKEDQDFPAYFNRVETDSDDPFRPSLNEMVQPFLFPETIGFKSLEEKGLLAKAFYDSESEPREHWAAGYNWRSDYTASVFPEDFQELRDSASFWRDYNEAPGLFLSFYNLSYVFSETMPRMIIEFMQE